MRQLDGGVDDLGVDGRDGKADFALVISGYAARQLAPCLARIGGFINAGARPAIQQGGHVSKPLVHGGIQYVRVARVKMHLIGPRVRVRALENEVPAFTAVGALVDAPLTTGGPERCLLYTSPSPRD